jgi:hypothetical protein
MNDKVDFEEWKKKIDLKAHQEQLELLEKIREEILRLQKMEADILREMEEFPIS